MRERRATSGNDERRDSMTYLRESFAYAGRVLRTMTPANALEPAGGPYGGMSTRLGLTTLAVWHASDHYGQLVMYLRMNGIVPPASRPAPVEPASASVATVFKDGGAYGTVTRVELPFGNLDTSFVESDVRVDRDCARRHLSGAMPRQGARHLPR